VLEYFVNGQGGGRKWSWPIGVTVVTALGKTVGYTNGVWKNYGLV